MADYMELVKNSRLRETMIDRCEQELNHKETGREMRLVGGDVSKPQTNADRIRAMTDRELAEFITDRNVNEYTVWLLNADHGLTATQIEALKCNVLYDLMRWLQQPCEGD